VLPSPAGPQDHDDEGERIVVEPHHFVTEELTLKHRVSSILRLAAERAESPGLFEDRLADRAV
jgi:hypothetical protein